MRYWLWSLLSVVLYSRLSFIQRTDMKGFTLKPLLSSLSPGTFSSDRTRFTASHREGVVPVAAFLLETDGLRSPLKEGRRRAGFLSSLNSSCHSWGWPRNEGGSRRQGCWGGGWSSHSLTLEHDPGFELFSVCDLWVTEEEELPSSSSPPGTGPYLG